MRTIKNAKKIACVPPFRRNGRNSNSQQDVPKVISCCRSLASTPCWNLSAKSLAGNNLEDFGPNWCFAINATSDRLTNHFILTLGLFKHIQISCLSETWGAGFQSTKQPPMAKCIKILAGRAPVSTSRPPKQRQHSAHNHGFKKKQRK